MTTTTDAHAQQSTGPASASAGTAPVARETIAARIEQFSSLDAIAEPLQKAVRAAIPQDSGLKDALSGTWLGHPLHPPLTDVVIGAWSSAFLLDLFGGERARNAADRLIATGMLAALPTAAAGLSDWAELMGGSRRVGAVHATGNTSALALHTLSLAARRRGRRRRGILLSAAGLGLGAFSAWLGGHLSFGRGVGVNQTAFDDAPADWTPVLDETQLAERKLVGTRANGTGVLLVRTGGAVHALADRCSHRGCSLHEGRLNEDDTITCPCHGSIFRMDGSIVKGPATAPQPQFQVRTSAGKIEIRGPAAGS
jgi:nitrite reductase/ring-hydroxylating ferredoxin subunit/uncharacterized membrane protein